MLGSNREGAENQQIQRARQQIRRRVRSSHCALDLLILRTLVAGQLHGYGIAQRLKILSQDVLQVGESSLYPALQRLLLNGWVKGEWGASENNRRARFYTLTAAGRKRLNAERAEFERLVFAIQRVLETA